MKIYESDGFKVELIKFRIKGKQKEFIKLTEPDAVVVIALRHGKILLEKSYRRVLEKYLYELPAGYVGKNENSYEAAKRELEEETGYTPSKLTLLFKAHTAPGKINSMYHFFLAEDLKRGKKHLDEAEKIKSFWVSAGRMHSMIKKNLIRDDKSIAAYLYYRTYVEGHKS